MQQAQSKTQSRSVSSALRPASGWWVLLLATGLFSALAAGDAAAAPALTRPALEQAFNTPVALEFGTQPEIAYTTLQALKPPLPEDESKAGWEQLLGNDFKQARASFEKVLGAKPGHAAAVTGLAFLNELEGRDEDSIEINLARVRAAAGSPEGLLAINEFYNWNGAPLDASLRLDKLLLELIDNPQTDAGLRTILSASLSSNPRSHLALTAPVADKLFAQSGWISAYQLTFGPFGLYADEGGGNRQGLMQRPFAPEAGLGNLQFQETPPVPAPALPPRAAAWPRITIRNPETLYGWLSVGDQLPSYGQPAIFYTLTNLDAPADSDALMMLDGLSNNMVFLNGLPIWTPEAGANLAPNLYMLGGRQLLKVRLNKGHNPILIKHTSSDAHFAIRVLGADWQPIAGLAYAALTDEEVAKIRVDNVRGKIAAEPVLSYDIAYLVGSKDGRQLRRRLGDLVAAAAATDVARLPFFARQLLERGDYLSALALAESLRKTYPQSVFAQFFEAALQRSAVRNRQAADGRFGVTARASLEALAKKFPTLYAVRQAELEIAQERSDPEKTLTLARQLAQQFPTVPQSHLLLARVYEQRKWEPENEAEIGTYLELYSTPAAGGGGGEGYTSRVSAEAHRYAANFHERSGRQATYLKLVGEVHKAGLDSAQNWANHQFDIGQPAEGLKTLQEDLAAWPAYRRTLTAGIARYQRRLGNRDAYRTWLDQELERNPYNVGILNERILNSVRQGFTKDALADIDLYVARFGPSESLIRLELDLRQQDPLAWYKPYDLAEDAVNPKDFTVTKYQSADSAQLIDLRVMRFLPDTSYWEYRKEVTAPLVTNAVDAVSRQRTGSLKNVLEIKSHNPDGKSYIPEYMNSGTAEMYNVEVGTVVSTNNVGFHAANAARPDISISESFLAIDDPIGIKRLVVILPAALDAKLQTWMNLPEQIKHTRTEQGGDILHVFENTRHDPLKQEDAMPTQDLLPQLQLYIQETGLYHGTGVLRTAAPYYPSQLVVATAQAIIKDLPADATGLQKFDAIIKWVRADLKPGQGANNFDDMIAMKAAGDRPSRQDLAQALARAVQVPVQDVLTIGTYNPYRYLPPKVQRFVYGRGELLQTGGSGMLALQDAQGQVHYRSVVGQQAELYPTEPGVDPGLGANSELFNYITLAGPMGQSPRRYEGVRATSDALRIYLQVQVRPDNTALLTGRAFVQGRAAGSIREARTDARNRQNLDNRVARWFWPQFDGQKLEYLDGSDANHPLQIGASGVIGRLGQVDPGQPQKGISIPALSAPGRNSISPITGLIGKTEREYDYLQRSHVDSTQNVFYPAVLAYEAPAGWAWCEVPEDLVLDTEFGWYFCDYQVHGNRLEIHRGYMLPKQRLNPEQWKKFNAFLGAIRNFENLGKIVCKPLPGTAIYSTDTLSAGPVRTDLGW